MVVVMEQAGHHGKAGRGLRTPLMEAASASDASSRLVPESSRAARASRAASAPAPCVLTPPRDTAQYLCSRCCKLTFPLDKALVPMPPRTAVAWELEEYVHQCSMSEQRAA